MLAFAQKRNLLVFAFGLSWLAVLIFGTVKMAGYANTPGQAGLPPGQWPAASRMSREKQLPVLAMFVHPHCPCSKASIGELALLMAHCQGRVDAHVWFLQPTNEPADWAQTDTWRDAAAIPGVTVHCDVGGTEAQRFNIQTSGDTVLYNRDGRLAFHGGVTLERGHSGDNPGRDTLQALLLGQPARLTNTPVFGCSLFECKAPPSP